MSNPQDESCGCVHEIYARELSHRASNALQTALAAVHLGRRGRSGLDEAMRCLTSAAALHRMLASNERGLVDATAILETATRAAIDAAAAEDRIHADVHGDAILAETQTLRPLLMICTELVCNSIKHAFPDGSGRITVSLVGSGTGTRLIVEDDGICGGWRRPGGQGCSIVDALATTMGGSVDRSRTVGGSSRVTVTVPSISAAAAAPAGRA